MGSETCKPQKGELGGGPKTAQDGPRLRALSLVISVPGHANPSVWATAGVLAKKSGGRSGELLKLFGQVHREKGGGKELARPVYAATATVHKTHLACVCPWWRWGAVWGTPSS